MQNVEKWEEIGGNIDSGWGNNDFLWVIEGYSDTEAGVRLFRTTAQKCGRNTQVTRENKEANLKNWYFLVVGPSVGVLSLVSRRSVGVLWQDIREVKEVEILTNSTFSIWEFLGRSLVRLWFLLGLWHGRDWQGTREGNLNKSVFFEDNYWQF